MKIKKIISILLSLILSLSFSLSASAENVVISDITPAQGDLVELVSGGEIEFSCDVSGGALIKFVADGEVFAEFKQNGQCAASLTCDRLGIGNKRFEVIVLDASGKIYTKAITFETYVSYRGAVNPGMSTEVQNFNSISDEYANQSKNNVDTSLIEAFSKDFGWTLTGTNVFLKRLSGKSGLSGDYAIAVYPFNASGGNQTARFKLDSWTEEVTDGIISLEFDWAVLPVQDGAAPAMYGIPVPGAGDMLSSAKTKTVYDTDFAPTHGQWMSMRYEYNVDANTVSLWIDGVQYWDEVEAKKSTNNNLSQFVFAPVFWSGSNYFTSLGAAYFVFDNFEVYKNEKLMLNSLEYTKDGVSTPIESGIAAYGCESITADFLAPIGNLTDDDIELYADGKKIDHAGVSVEDNKLTVALPTGLSDKDIVIKTRSDLERLGEVGVPGGFKTTFHISSCVEAYHTVFVNSAESSPEANLADGDIVSAQYTAQNLSDVNQNILLVLALRENGSLVKMSAKNITVNANCDDTFELPPVTVEKNGNYEISLIAVGGFLNPDKFN